MKYIKVNNFQEAMAFAPTLNKDYVKSNQLINQKSNYIQTLDIVSDLMKEGWQLKGVRENKGKNRKVKNNYVNLHHPDIKMLNITQNLGANASLNITNDVAGIEKIKLSLGAYRQVCSNGLVRYREDVTCNIKHGDIKKYEGFINSLNQKSQLVVNEFGQLRNVEMNDNDIWDFAEQASLLRFEETNSDRIEQLLKLNRVEDRGNDAWTVFNRIQENLTSGLTNMSQNISINENLSKLIHEYVN